MNDEATRDRDEAAEAGRESTGGQASAETGAGEATHTGGHAEAAPKLKLRRLKIHRWRNVLPGTELCFGDGIHALLGKNGTGKTTLLKLISMCARGSFEEAENEELDFELDFAIGSLTRLAVKLSRYRIQEASAVQLPFDVDILGEKLEVKVERAGFSRTLVRERDQTTIFDDESRPIKVLPSYLSKAISLSSSRFPSTVARIAVSDDPETPESLDSEIHDAFQATESTVRFDEMLGFLAAMSGEASRAPSLGLWIYHQKNRASEGVLLAHEVLEAIPHMRWRDEKALTFSANVLPFLKQYVVLTGIDDAELRLGLRETRRADHSWSPRFALRRRARGRRRPLVGEAKPSRIELPRRRAAAREERPRAGEPVAETPRSATPGAACPPGGRGRAVRAECRPDHALLHDRVLDISEHSCCHPPLPGETPGSRRREVPEVARRAGRARRRDRGDQERAPAEEAQPGAGLGGVPGASGVRGPGVVPCGGGDAAGV